jgi:PAS domain-containing protein
MRRQDENSELTELAAILPMTRNSSSVDKISVVRLTTAYVKFRMFLHEANISWDPTLDTVFANGMDMEALHKDASSLLTVGRQKPKPSNGLFDLSTMINKAMDGFVMVVSPDGTVLYVPEFVTEHIGLTQAEMIGQSLVDLTHSEDQNSVERNLIYDPTDPARRQWRQFCVRFRTSLNTPRSPLSKFSGHKMMQISGFLKCAEPSVSDKKEHPKSLGLIAECRPIESMSIAELAIERSSFTTTTSLDLKFTAVESRVKTLIGFEPEEMMGLYAYDFFHPSDFKSCQPYSERAVKCRLTLLNQGRVVSPIHRFLTKSGEWIWTQMVCVLSYVPGTKTPFDIKVTFRIVSSELDRVNLIEHTEAYKGESALKSIQEPYQVHMENNTRFRPQGVDRKRSVRSHYATTSSEASVYQKQEILNKAISQTKLSDNVLESLLFSRKFALFENHTLPYTMDVSWYRILIM